MTDDASLTTPNLTPRRTGPHRSPDQRELDYVVVAKRSLEGKTLREIGEEIGVTHAQVINDLKVIRGRWKEASIQDVGAVTARELAKLDLLEATYWEAWHRSCAQAETTTQEIVDVPVVIKGQAVPAQRRTVRSQKENRDGNPRFLEGVANCIDRRCKLLGLDAPTQIDITLRVRQRAIAAGLDPDRAVAAAERILRERAAQQRA